MEATGAFGGRRSTVALLAGMVCLVLAIGFGVFALAVNDDYPAPATTALVLGMACAAIAGAFGGAWIVNRVRTGLRWWHILWLCVFLSGLVFRVRGAETIVDSPLDFWAAYRVGLMSVVGFGLLIHLSIERTTWIGPLSQGLIGLLAIYAVVSVASTAWSVYPGWTLYKSVEYLIDVALIAAVVASIKTAQAFKTMFDWTWGLLGMLIVGVYIGILVRPDLGVIRDVGLTGIQIRGVMPAVSADGVGGLGELLGIVAFTRLLFSTRHRWLYVLTLLIAITTLILAQSRGALSGFVIGLLVVLLATKRKGLVATCAVAVPAVIWLAGLGPVLWEFFLRGQSPELFGSLSGRVNWWEAGWELIKEHPLIGYGAYAGPRFAVLATLGATTVSTVHNTWLEILLGTGVLGLVPVLAVLLRTWMVLLRPHPRQSISATGQRLRVEALGVLAALSAGSIFSSEFISHPPLTFLLVLGYAEFLRRIARLPSP